MQREVRLPGANLPHVSVPFDPVDHVAQVIRDPFGDGPLPIGARCQHGICRPVVPADDGPDAMLRRCRNQRRGGPGETGHGRTERR